MLSLSFVTLSLFGLALASPTQRAENGLTVALTPSSKSVDSISDLKLTAAVTNNDAEDVKVLNYGSILDTALPTRSFSVTKNGAATNFTGIKLSLNTNKLTDAAYTVIPAGKTITVEHEVASLYDFASAGSGTFSFDPVVNFRVASGSNSKLARVSNVNSSPVQVSVQNVGEKREVEKRATKKSIGKRAENICTDSTKKSFIDKSYTSGKSLAAAASKYASSGGKLTSAYFGTTDVKTVTGVLDNVAHEDDSSRTLDCSDTQNACSDGVIAYTLTSTTNIYFCDIFFDEKDDPSALCSGTTVTDRDIAGGTTLHEMTHATSGTEDVGYGCDADQSLGSSDPSSAANNADNYNCFSTAVYAATC